MRAVTVVLPREGAHIFRYVAAGDEWFNDEAADGQNGPDSRVRP